MFFYLLPNLLSQSCTINFLYETLKISLIFIIAYVSYYYYKYFTRENPLPGPFPLPFIGNVHQVIKNSSYDVKNVHAKYGDLCEFYMGPRRFILVSDENLAQKIFKPTIKGPFHNRFKDDAEGFKEIDILNVGLVANNDYDDWSYNRRFFTKVIMAPQFIKHSVKVVQDNFSEMSKYWDKLGEDKILEFNNWMKRYFFDTIFITATSKPAYTMADYYNKVNPDEKLNISKSILKEIDMFLESMDAFTQSVAYFTSVPRSIRNFPGVNIYTRYLKDRISWLRNNVDNIIKLKREEISKTPIDQKLISDILTMFLTVNTERDVTERIADDLHDKPMPDKDIQSNFITIIAGGIDTAPNLICFLVYYLENNPRVKQKMIEEIERVLGKDSNYSIAFESLSKFEYVEAVIKEGLRLKTLVPSLLRINSNPEDVGGHIWSKETSFIINAVGIHNKKSCWKDPDTFNPDRFLEDSENKHLYAFGGGLKKCPGGNLAIAELKVTIVMLYRKYNIELIGPLKEHSLTTRHCDELKVRLRKRKN